MVDAYTEEWEKEFAQNKRSREAVGEIRWANLIKSIFPSGPVCEKLWGGIDEIVDILQQIGEVDNTNHMFCPGGGGFDLTGAGRAGEVGCIELLTAGAARIIKPAKLSFHAFGSDPLWYYFRLENKRLEPTDVYESVSGNSEELCELSPGEYVDRSYWDEGYYDSDENGYLESLPEEARPVVREFGGSFVIFGKYSTYNLDNSTYDGRHDKGTSEQFADYIRKHTDAINI
jgi:hypothetical protein